MQTVKLSIKPGGVNPGVFLSQYDNGRQILFQLFDENGAYTIPTGANVYIRATKPSGFAFSVNLTGISGNEATATVIPTMSAESGSFPAELRIENGGQILGTANFLWNVERSPHLNGAIDGDAAAESLYQDLIDAKDAANEAAENADTATAAAQAATSAANTAAASANTAATAANTAAGSANTATTAANIAAASANTAADAANAAAALAAPAIAAAVKKTVSGAVASFNDGAEDAPIYDMTIQIEPVQEGSGDPSPTNIRPISGWTGANVIRTGKNILPTPTGRTNNGITFTVNDDGSVTANGTASANATLIVYGVPLIGTLILSGCPSGGSANTYSQYITGSGISAQYDYGSGRTITPPDGVTSGNFVIRINNGQTVSNLTFYPMLRLASDTDATYEPYKGSTYPITWPEAGTIYGGYVDVKNGKLVKEYGVLTLGSQTTVTKASNATAYWVSLPTDVIANNSLGTDSKGWCSHYALRSPITSSEFYASDLITTYSNSSMTGTQRRAWFIDSRFSTAADFKQYLTDQETAGTPVQYVYKLETPVEYDLTDLPDIRTLKGINNIWSDTGDVSVIYYPDLEMYINERTAAAKSLIAGIEDTNTATRNYSIGDFLIVGDNLYKVTAAIANGGTITPETNVTSTTVAEQLRLLFA